MNEQQNIFTNVRYSTVLYKRDSVGNIRQWNIEVADETGVARISILSGLMDGKKVSQVTEITEGKNQGRANETSYLEQAILEAKSKVAAQVKDGYVESLADIKDSGIKGSGTYQVMLAKPYDPVMKQSGSKDLKGYKLLGKTVCTQRKYDGVRRLTKINQDGVWMYTRSGDLSTTLPHIEDALHAAYKELGFTDDLWVDGEAYSHVISFNKVNGISRKGIKTAEDHYNRSMIEYHVYDAFVDGQQDSPFHERFNKIVKVFATAAADCIKLVETKFINNVDADALKSLHDEYVQDGYEGLIIRDPHGKYEHKRSPSLLKYKAFEDANFLVLDVLPSVEGDRAGTFRVKMDQPAFDAQGRPIEFFDPTAVGSIEERKEWLANKDQIIGRIVKVNFFGRSEYGVPRFPRVKGLVLNQ